MRRLPTSPRPDWRRKVEALGLVWHTADGVPYWNESACYRFDAAQIDQLEAATAELYRLCLAAGEHIVQRDDLLARFGIPPAAVPLIREAWAGEPPALNHGRFDLAWDGRWPPKLLEFNCDTPTALLEASVAQWDWKEEVFPRLDQFNSLHDKLVAKWRDIRPYLKGLRVHFTSMADAAGEDVVTTAYLRDTARLAGLATEAISIGDVGWRQADARFVDLANRPIDTLFHLYPWEWLLADEFGAHIAESAAATVWIEPIWKMMWSNKALAAVLWELFPDHPNLLEASFEPLRGDHVIKPLLSREGSNITIVRDGRVETATEGPYADGPVVYQAFHPLPAFDGVYPVVGSWVVDGAPAGMGIREGGPITANTARFVPHVFG